MKFPRNARIFRGQLDAAPLASVFFLLALFMMVASLVYTPGVALRLPVADDLPGRDQPMVAVAIDSSGRLYYENQGIQENDLRTRLDEVVKESRAPLTLLVEADKAVTTEMLVRLSMLARGVGITNGLLATLPRPAAPAP